MPEQAANRAQKPDRIGQTEGRMFAQSSYLQGNQEGSLAVADEVRYALGLRRPSTRCRARRSRPGRVGAAIVELFDAWHVHHGERPVKASTLPEPVRVLVDPPGQGHQNISRRGWCSSRARVPVASF
jgi:hypothetical protein